jgi:hypothetical protein
MKQIIFLCSSHLLHAMTEYMAGELRSRHEFNY